LLASVAAVAGPSAPSSSSRAPAPAINLIDQKRVLSYPFEQVWPTSVRFLRIDRGYTIDEKDPDAGFVLFTFPLGPEATGSGSLELLRTQDASGRASVEARVSTTAGPAHLPHTILDGLAAKLRAERGQPAPPPPAQPPDSPPPDPPDPPDGAPPLLPPAQDPTDPAPESDPRRPW
jgi:hypothetical protein